MSLRVSSADGVDLDVADFAADRLDIADVDAAGLDLADIESFLEREPDVAHAVVVARPDAGGERLVAYLTLTTTAGVSLDEDALREALRRVLPRQLLPSSFVVLAELPRRPDGEIDRTRLDDDSLLRRAPDAVRGTPANELERRLLALFEEVLRVWPLGTEESFFALSGDAHDAERLCTRISQELGVHLGAEALLEAASVRGLARRLAEPSGDDSDWQVRVQSGDGRPPVFFLPGVGGSSLGLRALAGRTDPRRRFIALPWPGADGASEPSEDLLRGAAQALVSKLLVSYKETPIYLVGEGAGGALAYEMATQLAARGRPPALLALLDSARPPRSPRRHPARRYDGEATLFRATSLPSGLAGWLDPLRGWRELFGQRLEVVTLPAPRGHLLREPHVESLVPSFGRILARADANARVWTREPETDR